MVLTNTGLASDVRTIERPASPDKSDDRIYFAVSGWPCWGDCDLIPRMARRPVDNQDREAVAQFIEKHWKSRTVMSRGRAYSPYEALAYALGEDT